MSSPRSNVLADRDPNVSSPEKNKTSLKGNGKPQDATKSLEYHRQALEARLKESKSVNTNTTPQSIEKTQSQPSAARNGSAEASIASSNSSSIMNQRGQGIRQAHATCSLSSNQQTYVSPSDNIMSPATAKLAAFKNRHVKR